jgi:hypothetical protein
MRVVSLLLIVGPWAIPSTAQPPGKSMFVFQNGFWLNLHQFLRGEMYRRGAKETPGLDPASLDVPDRATWQSALDAYTDLAKRNVIFDPMLVRIANALAQVDDVAHLPESLIDPGTTAALNAAAPIYRARLWPARRRDNDAWIASAKQLIGRHETAMASRLAATYFTSGAVASRELATTGNREYVPYGYRYNQYLPSERLALERDWQPYLEGKTSFEQALHDLVRDAR